MCEDQDTSTGVHPQSEAVDTNSAKSKQTRVKSPQRKEALSHALRENLQRRKAQARKRKTLI